MISKASGWYVYILRCKDGTLYTGITNDVKRRVQQHNGKQSGGARYTRAKGPVELLYKEKYKTRSAAAKREYYIKNKLSRQQKQILIDKPLRKRKNTKKL